MILTAPVSAVEAHDYLIDLANDALARSLKEKARREFLLLCSLRRHIEAHAPETLGELTTDESTCRGCDSGAPWVRCPVLMEAKVVLEAIS